MSLCQDCQYQELPNNSNSTVKSYALIVECDACRIAREAQVAYDAVRAPYRNVDSEALLLAIKGAFPSRLLELGGVFAVISPYITARNWDGLNSVLADLATEGVAQVDIDLLKATISASPFLIDLDNIPEGV
jgi:hypothetical protein